MRAPLIATLALVLVAQAFALQATGGDYTVERFGEASGGGIASGSTYAALSTILTGSGAVGAGGGYVATIGLGSDAMLPCEEGYAACDAEGGYTCRAECSGTSACDTNPCDGCSRNDCGGSGGGGGGGGSFTPTTGADAYTHTWSGVVSGKTLTAEISRTQLAVTKIVFLVVKDATSFPLTVKNRDATIPAPPGLVYAYFEVTHPEGVSGKATITFRVPKAWLSQQGITAQDILLYRREGTWKAYKTVVGKQDATYVTFIADVPGLSTFAIGAVAPVAPIVNEVTGDATEILEEEVVETVEDAQVDEEIIETTSVDEEPSLFEKVREQLANISWTFVAIPLIAILLIAGVVVVIRNAHVHPRNLEHKQALLGEYVKNALAQGHSPKEVHDALLAHGWPLSFVEEVLPGGHKPSDGGLGEHPADPLAPLRGYIEHQRRAGVPENVIAQHLLEAGWKQKVVEKTMKATVAR